MAKPLRLLIVEDSPDDAELLIGLIRKEGYAVTATRVDTADALRSALDESGWDVILSDYIMPGFNALMALKIAREIAPDVPLIVVSGTVGEEVAVETMRSGALDYLMKDRLVRLVPGIENAIKHARECAERKRTEEALKENEARYRSLFENMLNGFAYCRMEFDGGKPRDFVYLTVNGAFETLTGLKEVAGKKVSEVIPGIRETDPGLLEIYGRVASTGMPERFEIFVAALKMWFAISVYCPKKDHFVAVFDVITDRKRAEEALRESEANYRGLIENSVIGFYRGTPDGRIIVANPALLAILGYASLRELQERQLEETGFRPARSRGELLEILRNEGKVRGFETTWLRSDGGAVHLRESVRAIHSDDARIAFVEGFVEDITHLKELEEQFLQAQKMEALGRLAGGVAHDFNNVLMALMSYSDLMLRALPADDPLALYAREIRTATDRAADLTGKLLAFSRRQVVRTKPMALNAVIEDSMGMLRPLIMEDVEVSTRLQPDLPAILADPNQIVQVLTNLAVNARDAMPQGGVLIIQSRTVSIGPGGDPAYPDLRPGDYVELSVADTRCGMTEEVKRRAFEPFFTTKEKGKGTGLGLSTCFGIVKQAGGDILLDSLPGQGTRVKILFPPHGEAVKAPAAAAPAPSAVPAARGTVLLVEDEHAVRIVLTEILTMHGFTVIEAMNAEEALRKAEGAPVVDCVITDVVMPLMSGPELVARLSERRPGLKVILMSGHAGEDLPDRYNERGYKFLQKPFAPDTLIRLVRERLGQE